MFKNLILLTLGIATFFFAVNFQNQIIGNISLLILSVTGLSVSWSTWKMFLSMNQIELNSYNANSLAHLDMAKLESNHLNTVACFEWDYC
jgi:hypothetical protein